MKQSETQKDLDIYKTEKRIKSLTPVFEIP